MKKIFIGITTSNMNINFNLSLSQNVTLVANSYIQIVNDYDCVPVLLPVCMSAEQINAYILILDGLILTSGQDIAVTTYGGEGTIVYSKEFTGIGEPYKRPMMLAPDLKRDEVEISLYYAAKKKGIPIIGICRGMQLMNVAEKGTLYEELPESEISHYIEPDGWINYHEIELVEGTLGSTLIGLNNYIISSIHHQAINKLAKDFSVSAHSKDGIIEMIEHVDKDRFIMGIQGHIEKTRKNQPLFEKIFQEFFIKSKLTINDTVHLRSGF